MKKAELILDDYSKDVFQSDLDISVSSKLYQHLDNRLKNIFGTWHHKLNTLFSFMNEKSKVNRHFNASDSRELIYLIDQIFELESNLKGTQFEFDIDPYIRKQLKYAHTFLVSSGGSAIPDDFEKIAVKKYDPIFLIKGTTIEASNSENLALQTIGEGAFAIVSKYEDPTYNIFFAVKNLKRDADEREKQRFFEEYKILKRLNSPYILSVYRFDEKQWRYIMEYCDTTLKRYYDKENSKISFYTRKRIALQFLYAMSYIHHKKIFHRDLSPHNILLKIYDSGVLGVKLSDFGLMKKEDSDFTKSDTEIKGSIVDPALDGFKNYSLVNEIYAIGRILNYIFSGKQSFSYAPGSKFKRIIVDCTNSDLKKRFKNVQEILKEIDELTEEDL